MKSRSNKAHPYFDLDTAKIQSLALLIIWWIRLSSPATIWTGDRVWVKVLLNLAASSPVATLKSELRRDNLLLSLGSRLDNFFGLLPNIIKLVLWLWVSFSPLWIALTTSSRELPSTSQCSLYIIEVMPSVPGAALRLELKTYLLPPWQAAPRDFCCLVQ